MGPHEQPTNFVEKSNEWHSGHSAMIFEYLHMRCNSNTFPNYIDCMLFLPVPIDRDATTPRPCKSTNHVERKGKYNTKFESRS